MKYASIYAACAFFIFISNAWPQVSQYDFRSTIWGMSFDEVLKSEPSTFSDSLTTSSGLTILIYLSTLNSLSCELGYIFVNNQLTRAKYIFSHEHSNQNEYISDYNAIITLLSKKYNKPIKTKTIWNNNLYRNNNDDWGTAVSIGHLSFYSIWNTETTSVICYLKGDNFKINFGIEYTSLKLQNMENTITEKNAINDL